MAVIILFLFQARMAQHRSGIAVTHLTGRLRHRLRQWYERRIFRRMLRGRLLPGSDSVLADAGWTRDAAIGKAAKPFWQA